MRTAYILSTFAMVTSSCAPSAPTTPFTSGSVLTPLSSAADSRPTVELDAPAIGAIVQLPERPTSPEPSTTLHLAPTTSVVDAATRAFTAGHQSGVQTEPVPLPTDPTDPSDPEPVAAFVVALWSNPQPAGERWPEIAADWLAAGFADDLRTTTQPASSASQHSAVTGTDLFEAGFGTRVLVTIERLDRENGAFTVSGIEVLLTPTDQGWAVASLEIKR